MENDLHHELNIRTKNLQEANKKLKELSRTDYLTGIFNRRYFYDVGKQYLEIAKRNQNEMCVVSFDLDKFKNINDTYGHKVGDLVLIEFTKIINTFMRKSDLFGRIGGEEFSVIFQNTTIENTLIVVEKIREKVEMTDIINEDKMIHMSVSIGVVKLTTEDTIEELGRGQIINVSSENLRLPKVFLKLGLAEIGERQRNNDNKCHEMDDRLDQLHCAMVVLDHA